MKLVLVDNLILPEPGDVANIDTHPHLGLLSLAAIARLSGHSAVIFDPKLAIKRQQLRYDETLYTESAKAINAMQPDVVGFTSMGCSFIYTAKVAEELAKLQPDLPLILGGPHASILWREILLGFQQFSIVVCHEAEHILVPVLEHLVDGHLDGISGVCWRDAWGVIHSNGGKPTINDLDSLPIPDYANYPMDLSELSSIRIDAGRGCPFDCTFCSTASYFGRSYRLKSSQRLLEEMDFLNNRFGCKDFKLNHDLFTVNKKKVHAFCTAVKSRNYTWAVSARIDCVDKALLEHMWKAGCRAIYFGIEAGSERMQKISYKQLKLDLLEPTLDICERLGYQISCSYITGYPEETWDDQRQTLNRMGLCFYRNREKLITQLHMLTPEPGTALYNNAIAEKFTTRNPSQRQDSLASSRVIIRYDGYQTDFNGDWLDETEEELIRAHPDVFVPHYYYSSQLTRCHNIQVVESYKILRKLGHTILSYILRHYDRQFASLIDELISYFKQHSVYQSPSKQQVIDFFTDRFGSQHHISSLVRYGLLTEEARKQPPAKYKPCTPYDEHGVYQLRPGTYLFKDIHNCSLLIEKIQCITDDKRLFSQSETGERSCLLVASHSDCDNSLINYTIDLVTYTLLRELSRPSRLIDIQSRLKSKLNQDDIIIDRSCLKELQDMGLVIRPASGIHRAPPRV
jgi:radical SAM superfamily enzyme YgiQ (UPF0313 family)